MKKKIKVLIICMEYPPFVAGGLGIHYFELTNELKKLCNVELLCARFDSTTPAMETKGDLTIHRLLVPKIFPFNHIVFNLKAIYVGAKIQKDLVHICSPFGLFNALFTRKPLVVKMHSVYKSQKGSLLYNLIFFPLAALIDKILIKKSDLVITTSNFMKDEILNNLSLNEKEKKKVKVIYNGVNKIFFKQGFSKIVMRKKLKIDSKLKVILYVGRFVKRKNALLIIEAIPKILKREKNILFLFVGGGFTEGSEYQKKILETLKTLKLENYVRIVPWVSHKELINYYRSADLFIHPAEYEPFGNNVLEAMAAGLPILAMDLGGPKEILLDSGILLNSKNPRVAKTILKLLENSSLTEQLARFSIKRAREFSWSNNAKETLLLYQDSISEYANN